MEKLTCILAVPLGVHEVDLVAGQAMTLATHFGARLEVLIRDLESAEALTTLCREREFPNVTLCSVADGSRSARELILDRVRTSPPDLVVKTPATRAGLRSLTVLDEDWTLANECPVPILLARGKTWASPLRFAAAVDVSDDEGATLARAILHTAGFLALGAHAHVDILYTEREASDEALRMRRAVRLAQLVREFHVGSERLQMFAGEPETRLPPLFAARRYDVVVLGGPSRREGLANLLPGTASRILAATDSDVILVGGSARVGDEGREERECDLNRSAANESARAAAAN